MVENISNGFVCAMGIGVVFVGLICIVVLCMIMSFFCKEKNPQTESQPAAAAPVQAAPIANKQELIAGICAVIAEELGTDVTNIRVLSFKKMV